jgi:hypothetical protein
LLIKKTVFRRLFICVPHFEVPSGLPPALRACGDPVVGGCHKGLLPKTEPCDARPGFYLPLRGLRASSHPLRRKQKNRLTAVFWEEDL